MKEILKNYFFQKHILVSESGSQEENILESLFALANLFQIRITEGEELVRHDMIAYVSGMLGEEVPEPFYRGFPKSVRKLSEDKLLFDQLLHYTKTYGFGDFSEAGHSLFEERFEKIAFREKSDVMEFVILSEAAAAKKAGELAENLLRGTRPLSEGQLAFVETVMEEYGLFPAKCASKNTAVRLLLELGDRRFAKFLSLKDVVKVAEELNFRKYGEPSVKKLNLMNQDRKLLTALIDELVERPDCDIRSCYEKKAVWCGLLHHIHYVPKSEAGRTFADAMRRKGNNSVYAGFERCMREHKIPEAASVLREGKGSAAVIRNLQYLISRCETIEEVEEVLRQAETQNAVVLYQLLLDYGKKHTEFGRRVFCFTKFNMMKVHPETEEEISRRKSVITEQEEKLIADFARTSLGKLLKNSLGKVYVDPDMKHMALPIQENTGQSGLGVLSKGSRIPIAAGKKIRAFTYWEKVNDIDLSVFGLDSEGNQTEFSWRTMAARQSDAIVYSGDETSGYHGGSEYFDIDPEVFRSLYPQIRYLIFCDNVYSGVNFDHIFCKAGYMLRDREGSGGIFEPKTVKSSFFVNCQSTFAYLFGIDLEKNEFVWLNISRNSAATVAGTTDMSFLTNYFQVTDIFNLFDFFEMAAGEMTDDPGEADIIVSDTNFSPEADMKEAVSGEGVVRNQETGRRSAQKEVIRSYDFERILALMNRG